MQLVRITAAFLLVFGLLGLLFAFTRRKRPGYTFRWLPLLSNFRSVFARPLLSDACSAAPPALEVTRRISLTPTHKIHLISTAAEQLLVCTHPNGCTVLNRRLSPETEKTPGERFYSLVHDDAL